MNIRDFCSKYWLNTWPANRDHTKHRTRRILFRLLGLLLSSTILKLAWPSYEEHPVYGIFSYASEVGNLALIGTEYVFSRNGANRQGYVALPTVPRVLSFVRIDIDRDRYVTGIDHLLLVRTILSVKLRNIFIFVYLPCLYKNFHLSVFSKR